SVPGRLYDLGRYPGAVHDPRAATRVRGRVLRLPEGRDVLPALDRYEGFDPAHPGDSLYLRVPQRVDLADGGGLLCWVYVYNRDPGAAPVVPDGDYAAWRARPD
ncbi:MAG TPA: gamma-glutamylcyclotransferase family protein, partial [Gemmataceae bacterium]|nr:gamma-glutamylcyclotransferase family protein [Gemmataceae bacterium]